MDLRYEESLRDRIDENLMSEGIGDRISYTFG